MVQEGSATFTAGDDVIEATGGQVVVVPAGVAHKFVNSGDRAAAAGRHTRQRPFRYRVARMTEAGQSPSRATRLPIATGARYLGETRASTIIPAPASPMQDRA